MGKYDGFFVTGVKAGLNFPDYRGDADQPPTGVKGVSDRIVYMDSEVVPGAFYSECVWFWPKREISNKVGVEAHTHPFQEVIAFFGTNPDDPQDLGGEIELWLEDEKHVMTQSFICYIPANVKHCPLILRKVHRPIFHFTIGPGEIYK